MTAPRTRAISPSGAPRIYLDTPRASTGTVLASTYDTRYDTRQPVRSSFSAIPSSASTSSGRSNSVYDTQPVKKTYVVDPSHGTVSRTQYAVRPRRESLTSDSRRPLSVKTNASPTRPEFTDSPRDLAAYSSKPRDDGTSSRHLQPTTQPRSSQHHQRHNSATRAEASRYFGVAAAPRVERAYHSRGPYVEKVADSRPAPRRVEEPAIEYTGPREQFARDYPEKPRARRESLTRRERPNSAMATNFDEVPFRRETLPPPPSASRQFERIERDDRNSGFESDPDKSRDSRLSRRLSKGPVVHQREDGYSSAREEYDPRRASRRPYDDEVAVAGTKYRDVAREPDRDRDRDRERERERTRREFDDRLPERDREKERRERRIEKPRDRDYERDDDREREKRRPRDYEVIEDDDVPRRPRRREPREERDPSPDRSNNILKTIGTAAVGGLAAAGLANRKSAKDDEGSDSDSKRERRRRRRRERGDEERRDEDPEARRRRRERRAQKENKDESSGSDTPDEAARRRPQSRTRRRGDDQEGYGSDRERARLALPAPEPERRASREPDPMAVRGVPTADFLPDRIRQESPTNSEGRTVSPGEGEDGRPRKVSIVEPGRGVNRAQSRPRGILKPPRAVPFPEDPNPSREGVAPLKQAGKDGVPAGARWTKVSRILVNPEALEQMHERFEERDDYVIVLRVLTREEIEKMAEKTRKIRGKHSSRYEEDSHN